MKVLSAMLVAGLTSMSLVAPASAFTFAPKSVGFTAVGPVVLAKPTGQINCTMSAKGVTTAIGTAKITSVSFIPGVAACANTAAQGLPWPAKATGAGVGKIFHVELIGLHRQLRPRRGSHQGERGRRVELHQRLPAGRLQAERRPAHHPAYHRRPLKGGGAPRLVAA